jgi:DNA-binding NarL/FixJ family response regulator
MFRAGATGYLLKDSKYDELIGAIRTVAEGQTYVSPSTCTRVAGPTYSRTFLTFSAISGMSP